MYFPYFMAYILMGVAVAVPVFYWAMKTRQFSDADRARFLPLEAEDRHTPAPASRMSRIEAWGLILLATGGLAASASVLIFALRFGG